MSNLEDMVRIWETIKAKKDTKVMKAISKDDHEFLELKDKYGNKFEIKFYPNFFKGDEVDELAQDTRFRMERI